VVALSGNRSDEEAEKCPPDQTAYMTFNWFARCQRAIGHASVGARQASFKQKTAAATEQITRFMGK
jgi:hypothetical protein